MLFEPNIVVCTEEPGDLVVAQSDGGEGGRSVEQMLLHLDYCVMGQVKHLERI
jgi:hypothetical protein